MKRKHHPINSIVYTQEANPVVGMFEFDDLSTQKPTVQQAADAHEIHARYESVSEAILSKTAF